MVIFTLGNNTFEVKYDRIGQPVRMRASNWVRRWELTQLEERTEHLFEELVRELRQVFHIQFSPDGVRDMADRLYDEPNGQKVETGLHHSHHKLRNLSLCKFLQDTSHLAIHSILLELDIVTFNSVKVVVTIFVSDKLE